MNFACIKVSLARLSISALPDEVCRVTPETLPLASTSRRTRRDIFLSPVRRPLGTSGFCRAIICAARVTPSGLGATAGTGGGGENGVGAGVATGGCGVGVAAGAVGVA